MNLNDLFPNIYVINVDSLTDRWNETKEILDKKSITYERFQGIVPNEGKERADRDTGCFLSHKAIVESAAKQKLDSVLVFEDDMYFDPKYNIDDYIMNLAAFLYSCPWELFYLGGNHEKQPSKTNYPNIVKVLLTKTTHAIAYHKSSYELFLNSFYRGCPVDDFTVETFQRRGYSYCTSPRLVSQRAGTSYILDGYRDNNYCLLD